MWGLQLQLYLGIDTPLVTHHAILKMSVQVSPQSRHQPNASHHVIDATFITVSKAHNYRICRIMILHLATIRGRSTTDSSLYSQSSCKKVERKGDTLSKTCKGLITTL